MKIEILGPVAKLFDHDKSLVFRYQESAIWNASGVSLARRGEIDKSLARRVAKILKSRNLEGYIVPADVRAPTRCIDGRIFKGWDKDEAIQQRTLGPKVAGGTAHAALAHRIVDAESLRHDLKFEHDIQYVIKRHKEIGIGFGGHIDDHQHGSNTGCGAVDNINLILDRVQSAATQQQLRRLTNLIMGEAYDGREIANEIIGRMLYLDALKPRYLPRENDDPKGEFLYKRTVVDTIRREASATRETVPQLTGPHNEVAIVLNFLPDTTFDTDRFSHDNGNEIQVFGWDVWEMFREAERLYPYSLHRTIGTQRRVVSNRIKYLTARTLLGLAALMVLTDGSLLAISVRSD